MNILRNDGQSRPESDGYRSFDLKASPGTLLNRPNGNIDNRPGVHQTGEPDGDPKNSEHDAHNDQAWQCPEFAVS